MKKATCQENIEPAPKLWLQVSSAGPGRGEHDSLKGWDGVRGLGFGVGTWTKSFYRSTFMEGQ